MIFSSKEKRAIESGKILSKELAITAKEVEGLQERNWGKLSGKPWSDIKMILDPMNLEERYTYTSTNGESWQEFEQRLIKAIKSLINSYPNKNIVVITHGGAISALMPFLLNVPKEESLKYDFDNASVTVFEVISPNKYKNIVINSTDNLPGELKSIKGWG